MFPKASDKTFLEKLHGNHLGKTKSYGKAGKPKKAGQAEAHFELHHYAGSVSFYRVGFVSSCVWWLPEYMYTSVFVLFKGYLLDFFVNLRLGLNAH